MAQQYLFLFLRYIFSLANSALRSLPETIRRLPGPMIRSVPIQISFAYREKSFSELYPFYFAEAEVLCSVQAELDWRRRHGETWLLLTCQSG